MRCAVVLVMLFGAVSARAELRPYDIKHVQVYYEAGRFGGWPANHGIWIWGNEILVGFSKGYYQDLGPDRHHIDREKTELHCLARSLDGGETWTITDPGKQGDLIPQGTFLHGKERTDIAAPPLQDCAGGIDFTHPDLAFTARTDSIHDGQSRFFYSYDRGHSWEGPFRLPDFGAPGTSARTDYIVNGKHDCTLMLTAAKANRREGRVICVRTRDGGRTWTREGDVGPETDGFAIMPATVRVAPNQLLTALRRREGKRRWISAWESRDDGRSWSQLNDPVSSVGEGNPGALLRLQDGRLCLAYGYRAEPFSMRAKLSSDNGRTWGRDIVLRADGSNRDVGYPRMVQRPDGKLVVLYYFNDPKTGPERYIGATIFDPDSAIDIK